MICIPIIGRSQSEIAGQLAAAAELADLVELRMDYAPHADLRALLENRPCPVIVTNRPEREGGAFKGGEDARIAVLQKAIDLGADCVDVELDSVGRLSRNGRTKLIVSVHNFSRIPENLDDVCASIARTGADIVKVACMVKDIRDNLRLFDLLRRATRPTIALGMGELGLISRILGRKFGNVLTFASLEAGKESAPGQITAAELHNLYRYKSIGPETAVYGVIANPVSHSMSPAIHNAAFAQLGIDAVYVPFKVEGDPAEFVRAFRSLDVQGYSVTLPHKEAVIPAMDDLDPIVKKTGVMNTAVNRNGRLFGTNTDVPAAMQALEGALRQDPPQRAQRTETESPLNGRRVLLVGAGGAARAVAFGLTERGARVVIANRTRERAVKLAQELRCEVCPMAQVASCEADILVNTTSVGMKPNADETPVPRSALRKGMVVFDAVYTPPETRLLREAREAGCRTVSGIVWFVNQAALQFELWTGRPAPREAMEQVIRERLAVRG